ncbi:MAG: class I SAM-dependent methyltransferase [Candidatus Anammoxibacter sp.]
MGNRNERYKPKGFVFGAEPLSFLKDNIKTLPKGNAFVPAMGEGRNAVYPAEHGFKVEGCDISAIAIEKAQMLADKRGVKINTFVADLTKYTIKSNSYDLITCFYYLQRDLIPQIMNGLKPGGMVIFETYTVDQLTLGPDVKGPRNRDYLLEHNELIGFFGFFKDLRIILYEETIIDKKKAIARIIAEKN